MCIETAWMLCWETQAWLYRRWQITGILISLRCTNDAGFCFAFFKNKLKVCSNPALISTIFPTAFVLLVSVTFWWLSRWKGKWKSLSRVRLYGPWNSQARILECSLSLQGRDPGDLPNPGIEPRSPALQADSLPAEPQGKPENTGFTLLEAFPLSYLLQWSVISDLGGHYDLLKALVMVGIF